MKKVLEILGTVFVCLVILYFVFLICCKLKNNWDYNHKYSISMPTITGEFNIDGDWIHIYGLENLISNNDNIASLNVTELDCSLNYNKCSLNRVNIIGLWNSITIGAVNEEYNIKYKDKNKIIFSDLTERKTGEIDLNFKTASYTIKNAGLNNETRRYEILTNNQKIEKLEKMVIKKYLKKKFW